MQVTSASTTCDAGVLSNVLNEGIFSGCEAINKKCYYIWPITNLIMEESKNNTAENWHIIDVAEKQSSTYFTLAGCQSSSLLLNVIAH